MRRSRLMTKVTVCGALFLGIPASAFAIGGNITGLGSRDITPLRLSTRSLARGSEISGGADTYEVGPAFFRSSDPLKKINLCYEVSPNFGVPDSELESDLRWAFGQWNSYIEKKDLHYAIWTGSPGIVGALGEIRKGCDSSADLQVYFGVSNDEVARERPRFLAPYAFSAITAKSEDHHWNKGFLWVAGPGEVDGAKGIPAWNLPSKISYGALKVLLLHEVGHIFGNGHVAWTIMRASIGDDLARWTDPSLPAYERADIRPIELKIDQTVELIPNPNLAQDFTLARSFGCITSPSHPGGSCPDLNALNKAYERIFGKAPVGQLTASAHRLVNPRRRLHGRPEEAANGTGDLILKFRDADGTHTARIVTRLLTAEKDDSTPLFNGQHGNHFRSFGESFSGTLIGPDGRSFPVLVNYNMGTFYDANRWLSVIDLEQGTADHPLLVSQFQNADSN